MKEYMIGVKIKLIRNINFIGVLMFRSCLCSGGTKKSRKNLQYLTEA